MTNNIETKINNKNKNNGVTKMKKEVEMKNINVNKNDVETTTMSVKELMNNTTTFPENKDYSNLNDGVLPIQRLINNGFDVLLNEEDKVVVLVGESENLFEGMGSHRDEDLDELKTHYVDIEDITDYNSLWEMLKCGWDTPSDKRDVQYPYICVDGKWLRWDNQVLRMDMGIYHWDENNSKKFIGSIIKNQPQTSMMRTEVKIGRNEKCSCGSGKKFKKCCMNLGEV